MSRPRRYLDDVRPVAPIRASAVQVAQAELARYRAAYDNVKARDPEAAAEMWPAVQGLRLALERLKDEERDAPPRMERCRGEHSSEVFIMPGDHCPLCAAIAASKAS